MASLCKRRVEVGPGCPICRRKEEIINHALFFGVLGLIKSGIYIYFFLFNGWRDCLKRMSCFDNWVKLASY